MRSNRTEASASPNRNNAGHAMTRALAATVGLAGLLSLAVLSNTSRLHAQQPTDSTSRPTIHALARLEPEAGLITVGARPGARILKIVVKEGDVVKAGDLLAQLEGYDQALRQRDLAVAQSELAKEKRGRTREKAKLERAQVDQMIELQEKALTSQNETTRKKNATAQALYTGLSAVGGVAKLPPKDQVELEAALYLLQTQATKTQLDLDELLLKKKLLSDQRKLEDQELADGGLDDQILKQQIQIATAAAEQAEVRAPSAGTILSVEAHAGEVSSGALLTMGDLGSIAASAELDQADVGRVRVGDVARVTVIEDTVAGKVSRIGRLVGFNRLRSIDPRATQDLRVVRATIVLDRPEYASRFIGMQVEVAIEPASSRASEGSKSAAP